MLVTKKRTKTLYLVLHCSATSASMDIGMKEIDIWHRKRGWLGCGYNYVIRRNGCVEKARAEECIGAHCENYNSVSVGICLVGGVAEKDKKTAENNFIPEQFNALSQLLKDLRKKYPKAKIVGHSHLARTACPVFSVDEFMKENGFIND